MNKHLKNEYDRRLSDGDPCESARTLQGTYDITALSILHLICAGVIQCLPGPLQV